LRHLFDLDGEGHDRISRIDAARDDHGTVREEPPRGAGDVGEG
jgi:hypothetical protein